MAKVSILICTYNASESIVNTIQSCLHQSFIDFEILIHDDMSDDNTIDKILSIKDQRINIITSGKKLGPYGGLNFLLDHTKSQYIAILDHDDLRHPDKLMLQVSFLDANTEYVGCGTKTLMRYEGDQKGFAYYLGIKNYYTIHSSLVFRNTGQRYPIDTIYMGDAYFQKTVLCDGEKKIYNIDETLTLHWIKDGASNFSYKWFTISRATIQRVFVLHPVRYSLCIIIWETMRKLIYPILQGTGKARWIDPIERLPFVMMGNVIEKYDSERLGEMWVGLSPFDKILN